MKRLIFLHLLSQVRSRPHLKKKLKVFAIIGVIGFVVTSALVIWAGVSVVRFTGNQLQGVNVQEHMESLETRLNSLPAITTVSCWDKAQSLMNLSSWTTRPITDNFKSLKAACLEAKPPVCEGEACQELKGRMNMAESEQTI